MFEADLAERLERIFDFRKVSFDVPSESREQESMFVQIENAHVTIKDKIQKARVTGKIRVFASHDKLPYGYFAKRIAGADIEDTECFFFSEIDDNSGQFLNIAERSANFVYFFSSQYNPELGTMTSITISEAT